MRLGSVSFQRRWTTPYSSVMARSAAVSGPIMALTLSLGPLAPKISFSAVKAGSE